MHRTTVMIPEILKEKLEKEAEREKVSFGKLVRQAIEKYLLTKEAANQLDPFLSSKTVFYDEGPQDVSEKHDEHLLKREPY